MHIFYAAEVSLGEFKTKNTIKWPILEVCVQHKGVIQTCKTPTNIP